MKKFSLIPILLAFAALSAFAQTTIYTQNFSSTGLPIGWQNKDNTSNGGGKWTRKTNAYSFASATSSNGFYIFDSYVRGNDGKAENADLISGIINCSANTFVALQFQQFFLQFANSEGKVSVSSDGTNWTEVYSVSSSTENPEIVTIDISAVAANQPTVYLKFNYTGDYDYFWAIDDIKLFQPAPLDISVDKLNLNKYVGLNNQTVSGIVTNRGASYINSFDIGYSVNGGTTVYESFQGLSLEPFQSYNFTFNQKIAMSVAQVYDISVTALGPNNGTDANTANNNATAQVTALSAIPDKTVLVEEFTTAPCQYCPDGAAILAELLSTYSYAIPVCLHAGFGTDAMTTAEASTFANTFVTGAPSASVDRVLFAGEEEVGLNRGVWIDRTAERYTQISPATVAATSTYNSSTRELNVTVTGKFYSKVSGDYRLNAFLVEDSVTGTGSGYNQVNAYNTVSGHPFQGKGNPIIGFIHRHVERAVLGGTWGASGTIPATTADGGEYSKNFTYTIPASVNAARCRVVAFVHEYSTNPLSGKNEVLNSVAVPLNGSASQNATPALYSAISETAPTISRIALYPNPATDIVNLEYTLETNALLSFEVYNILGETVMSTSATQATKGGLVTSLNTANLNNGVYFVAAKDNNKVMQTLKFVVNK